MAYDRSVTGNESRACLLFLLSLLGAAAGAPGSTRASGSDVPPLVVRPESRGVEAEPPVRQQVLSPGKQPPAPLVEAAGAFTKCSAARLLELELGWRISNVDPARSSRKRWSECSRSQQLRERLEGVGSDCTPEERATAEQAWRLLRSAVEYPDLRAPALAKAPLTLSTATRAAALLDRVDGILENPELHAVRKPCPGDAACAAELRRREDLLEAVLGDAGGASTPR